MSASRTDPPVKLPLEFAFEGFRVIRERPVLIAWWGGFYLLSSLLVMVLLQVLFGDLLARMGTILQPARDLTSLLRMLSEAGPLIAPIEALSFLCYLAIITVLTCAIFRAVLGNDAPSLGYLRFGRDELLQLGVAVLFLVVSLFANLLFAGAGVVVGKAIAATGLRAAGFVVGLLLYGAAMVWFIIRFSVYGVATFARRKIVVLDAFRLTAGAFWPLLAGYLVAALMSVLVVVLFSLVNLPIQVVSQTPGVAPSAVTGLQALSRPGFLLGYLLSNGILVPLLVTISFAAPAAAYRLLTQARVPADSVF
jgi:hypothetical protein